MSPVKLGPRGKALIQKWEGLYLKAYLDSAGIWTIGWGSITNPSLGIIVHKGMVIDKETADKWFDIEIEEKTPKVLSLVKVPLTQYQFDVLMSFAYNLGTGALAKSTLLRLLNSGNYEAVPTQLLRFVNAGGKRIQGLVNRRRDEAKLWNNERLDSVPDAEIVKISKEKITPTTISTSKATKIAANSPTAKALLLQMMVAAGATAEFFSNPWILFALTVVTLSSIYIFLRKIRIIKELA